MAPEVFPPPQSVDLDIKLNIERSLITRYFGGEVTKDDKAGATKGWISIYADEFENILAEFVRDRGVNTIKEAFKQDPEKLLSEIESRLKVVEEK